MPEVPEDILEAARRVAKFSTVPEPPWDGTPHDVTQPPPPGLRPGDVDEAWADIKSFFWTRTLNGLDDVGRVWVGELREAVDSLAQALDAARVSRGP